MGEWKILEENNKYAINNKGEIINISTMKYKKTEIHNGYERVSFMQDGKRTRHRVHRLVAKYFIPNPLNKPQVNHIDGDRLNNNIKNLEWVTAQENTEHAIRIGLTDFSKISWPKGEENPSSKITEEDVIKIREMYDSGEFLLRELSEHFDLSITTIWNIAKRNTWTHI